MHCRSGDKFRIRLRASFSFYGQQYMVCIVRNIGKNGVDNTGQLEAGPGKMLHNDSM
jgi:hypothetical protein